MPLFLRIMTCMSPCNTLCRWYGSFMTFVATSGTSSVSMAHINLTVTVSLKLAVSSTASVSQPAVGSTATPAAVTHCVQQYS